MRSPFCDGKVLSSFSSYSIGIGEDASSESIFTAVEEAVNFGN
jgi:hypothetical protein